MLELNGWWSAWMRTGRKTWRLIGNARSQEEADALGMRQARGHEYVVLRKGLEPNPGHCKYA